MAAGAPCRRRCRLRRRLDWCTRRALMASRGVVLVPVHMGVCCAGGAPAGRCQLCVVLPVLCMCAATYSVHALYFLLVFRLICATLDACSALCLVLHCTAPLDVSESLTRMAQQHHHDNLSQHTAFPVGHCHCLHLTLFRTYMVNAPVHKTIQNIPIHFQGVGPNSPPVSYTHLTLPTKA